MPLQPSQRSGPEITGRDIEILRGLFECRVMTVHHIATLYFGDRITAARKRIWKLKTAGLVRERSRSAYEASVLMLTTKALRALIEQGYVDDYPRLNPAVLQKRATVSPLTLRHELDVMDVRAAFERAIAGDPKLRLYRFNTWPRMFEFSTYVGASKRLTVKPDGFVAIRSGEIDHSLFLEVDRSTESLEALIQRIGGYFNYYRQGGYAARLGYPAARFKEFPFRVMIVLRTAERRNNLAQKLLARHPPILTMAILTTMPELLENPLAAIWVRPIDYRGVTIDALLDSDRFRSDHIYRRDIQRDGRIEALIAKRPLI
jgi:hypothetical protein